MGGDALKKVIVSRINLDQYNKIKIKIAEKINKYLNWEFIIEVPGKSDFGDIDILYNFEPDKQLEIVNIIELIKNIFNPIEIV